MEGGDEKRWKSGEKDACESERERARLCGHRKEWALWFTMNNGAVKERKRYIDFETMTKKKKEKKKKPERANRVWRAGDEAFVTLERKSSERAWAGSGQQHTTSGQQRSILYRTPKIGKGGGWVERERGPSWLKGEEDGSMPYIYPAASKRSKGLGKRERERERERTGTSPVRLPLDLNIINDIQSNQGFGARDEKYPTPYIPFGGNITPFERGE